MPPDNTWGQACSITYYPQYASSGSSVYYGSATGGVVVQPVVAAPEPEPEEETNLAWLREQVEEITEHARAA